MPHLQLGNTRLKDYCSMFNISVETLSSGSGLSRRTLNNWWNDPLKKSAVTLMIKGYAITDMMDTATDESRMSSVALLFQTKGHKIN